MTQYTEFVLLNVAENTTGGAINVKDWPLKTFEVTIAGTAATVKIQGSIGGSVWTDLQSFTASGSYVENNCWKQVRAVSSSMTSATAKVVVACQG